jgi:hypothetical protein
MATRRDLRSRHSYLSAAWTVRLSPEGRKFEIRNFLGKRGHLDIGKSGIRNPESGFCFFCWNLFVLDIVCIIFISIASPRYISCRIVLFLFSGIKQLLITYKVHNFQSLACISTLLFKNSKLNFKKEIY